MTPYSLFTYPPPYDPWEIRDERDIERVATRIMLYLTSCAMVWFANFLWWLGHH